MDNNPLISVLVTSFNREATISETIESILKSDYQNFELIIVDDASTDKTVSIANGFVARDTRIKIFVNEQNLGDYPNRNKAATYAQGKYIEYVDSDDSIYAHSLGLMVSAMEKSPTAAFGFCDVTPNKNKSYPLFYMGKKALKEHFFNKGLLLAGPSNSIIRRDFFEAIGGFTDIKYISDYEAWLKFCLHYDVVIFEPSLMNIRLHTGQEIDVGKLAYYHLNYNVHKVFIKNPDAPFSEKEISNLLYNYKVLLSRRIYQRLLKWFGFKKRLNTIKRAGESPALFLWEILPMKK